MVTDAKAVTYIMNVKSPNLRLNRWFIFVQSFDFIIRYRKGKEHTVPDCLNRPPKEDNNTELMNRTTMKGCYILLKMEDTLVDYLKNSISE